MLNIFAKKMFFSIFSIVILANFAWGHLESNQSGVQISYSNDIWQYDFVTSEKLAWIDAFIACRNRSSTLASVDSKDELKYMQSVVMHIALDKSEEESYWVSGTDIFAEGNWIWITNGQPVPASKTNQSLWGGSEPSNGGSSSNQHCTSLWNGNGWKLDDDRCGKVNNFICKKLKKHPGLYGRMDEMSKIPKESRDNSEIEDNTETHGTESMKLTSEPSLSLFQMYQMLQKDFRDSNGNHLICYGIFALIVIFVSGLFCIVFVYYYFFYRRQTPKAHKYPSVPFSSSREVLTISGYCDTIGSNGESN